MSDPSIILGIESSCDETAAAVVRCDARTCSVLSNVIASQNDLHAEYRGVVPEIASRAHAERLLPVVRRALTEAGVTLGDVQAIAVGNRPGLIGCLLVGVAGAKALAWALGVPVVGVDHVQAHLYTPCLNTVVGEDFPVFPALGLVVSGGHTSLFRCDSPIQIRKLGSTIDDAVGEAFDKVAAILGLPFPGGPNVDRLAATGDPHAVQLPISRLAPDSLDFSFSGLKTAVLYAHRGVPPHPSRAGRPPKPNAAPPKTYKPEDIAASFQQAAIGALALKIRRAMELNPDCRTLLVGGGVSANSRLRTELQKLGGEPTQRGANARSGAGGAHPCIDVRIPPISFCLDNAAMIAGLGQHILRESGGKGDPLSFSAAPMSSL